MKTSILTILFCLPVFISFPQQILLVDFGNDFISFDFDQSFKELGVEYVSKDGFPDSLNMYKMIFVLLHYGDGRHILNAQEEQKLVDYLEKSEGRLYIEAGSYWSESGNSKLISLFKINTINNNNSDAYVFGIKKTFSEGFKFEPKQYNHYIDDIHPIEPATGIFSSFYGTDYSGVIYCGDNYKTIGVSYEFQELKPQNADYSKTQLLQKMLNYFEEPACAKPEFILQMFPNPTRNEVYVSSNTFIKKVTLYNVSGQVVKEVIEPTAVDMQYLQRGIYIARIEAGDGVYTRRIIKQ